MTGSELDVLKKFIEWANSTNTDFSVLKDGNNFQCTVIQSKEIFTGYGDTFVEAITDNEFLKGVDIWPRKQKRKKQLKRRV